MSPPTREAWIEITPITASRRCRFPSPPTREAWIEMMLLLGVSVPIASPPTREAWIEMSLPCNYRSAFLSPPTREAWIEMRIQACALMDINGRLPPGRRGLKSSGRPAMTLWVRSPPTREAWIEMTARTAATWALSSPPTREAWIEMRRTLPTMQRMNVASHPGGVD